MTTTRPRVVVLDDDEIFASLISESLAPECEVAIGRNGLEGITLCLDSRADIIVTDIGMPELDGIQLLRALSGDTRLSGIPVLVVTATHFSRQSREAVTRFPQVRDIMHKSSPLDSIAAKIKELLRGQPPPPPDKRG